MKKNLLIWLILLLMIVIPARAQGSEPPIPSAPPDGMYILDELGWLTDAQERNINNTIVALDRDGLAEIAVVTLNNCGSDKEAFRKSLFNSWGIGHTDDNDGLLILVCWYEGDSSRRSVEQVYGPGLNGILSSEKTAQIAQDEFVPSFQADKPGDGLVDIVIRYDMLLRGQAGSSNPLESIVRFFTENEVIQLILMLLVIGIVTWGFDKFVPQSFREHFRRDDDGSNSASGFGGGSSSGGGGSSTRF